MCFKIQLHATRRLLKNLAFFFYFTIKLKIYEVIKGEREFFEIE